MCIRDRSIDGNRKESETQGSFYNGPGFLAFDQPVHDLCDSKRYKIHEGKQHGHTVPSLRLVINRVGCVQIQEIWNNDRQNQHPVKDSLFLSLIHI